MSGAFVQPIYAGDRLTVRSIVKELRPEGAATRVVVACGAKTITKSLRGDRK
jgi:acyl dehydratase